MCGEEDIVYSGKSKDPGFFSLLTVGPNSVVGL